MSNLRVLNYSATTESFTGASVAEVSTKEESTVDSVALDSSVVGHEQADKNKIELKIKRVFFIFDFLIFVC